MAQGSALGGGSAGLASAVGGLRLGEGGGGRGGNHAVAVAASYRRGFGLGVFEGESPGRHLCWRRARRGFLGVSRGRGAWRRAVVRWLSRMAIDGYVRVAGDGGDETYEDNKDRWSSRRCAQHWQVLRWYECTASPGRPARTHQPTIGAGHPPVTPLNGAPGTLDPSPQIPGAVPSRYLPTRAQHREGLDPGPLISPHHR